MKRIVTICIFALCLLVQTGQANREVYDRNVALQERADTLAKQIQDMDRRIDDAQAALANLDYVEKANREYLGQLKNPQ
jgi:cell division protein FtsB